MSTTILELLESRRLLAAESIVIAPGDIDFAGGNVVAGSYRQGKSFTLARTLQPGQYELAFHFVEPHFKHEGKRLFDVYAEGARILHRFDIVAEAGRRTEVVKTFIVDVDDGQLDLAFVGVKQHALVSGVELTAMPPPPAPPAPLYINAGGASLDDSIARRFIGDIGFSGGAIFAAAGDVLNTQDHALFNTFRAGADFTFAHRVANGNYTLWLEFADPLSTAAGQRVFDVFAEGAQVLDDFDIIASAGAAQTAIARRFDLNIADGSLDLSFHAAAGDATINAIVLIPTDIPPEALPYANVSDYSDPALHAARVQSWTVRSQANLRNIGQSVLLWSNDHRGRFPQDLALLATNAYGDYRHFANPLATTALPRGEITWLEAGAWVAQQHDYLYRGAGRNNTMGGNEVLAYENPDRTPADTLSVLFGDGRVDVMPRANLVTQFGGAPVAPPPPTRPLDVFGDPAIIDSAANLRAMAIAMLFYSNDFKGRLPPDLGTLFLTQNIEAERFLNPRSGAPTAPPGGMTREQTADWINANTDYLYIGDGRRLSGFWPDGLIAYENPLDMPGGINLLFADGRVEFRETRWALETLARARVV